MKNMKKYIYKKGSMLLPLVLLAFYSSIFTSCDDWLDVKPKTQIEGSDMFSTETGYKDALNGVYINISSASMYGREMTYGLVDVIGDVYYTVNNNTTWQYAKSHDYKNSSVETLINAVWQQSYRSISTLNEIISRLNQADKSLFSQDNYNVIKGEALGLRGFLHFDLLRLFAPAPIVDANASAIPYVTTYSYEITPTSTVSETLDKVISDLETAADLLRASDPVVTKREITTDNDNGYLMNRQFHMNYYAVTATLARAYLYKGDKTNARKYAQEVIDCGQYKWTKVDDVATSVEANRDRTFTSEQIFALQIDNLDEYVTPALYGTQQFSANLITYYYWFYGIWPTATHSTDWRRVYFMTNQTTSASSYYTSSKLWQEGMNSDYIKRMPLIRLPEMYLILAECDLANAAFYLNTIRQNRGVTAPANVANENDAQDEITREYYREFFNEGQLFYRYKRINDASHFGGWYFTKAAFNTDFYVLPIPEEEIEFGGRGEIKSDN